MIMIIHEMILTLSLAIQCTLSIILRPSLPYDRHHPPPKRQPRSSRVLEDSRRRGLRHSTPTVLLSRPPDTKRQQVLRRKQGFRSHLLSSRSQPCEELPLRFKPLHRRSTACHSHLHRTHSVRQRRAARFRSPFEPPFQFRLLRPPQFAPHMPPKIPRRDFPKRISATLTSAVFAVGSAYLQVVRSGSFSHAVDHDDGWAEMHYHSRRQFRLGDCSHYTSQF
jgi:hypothetical protein